MKNTSSQQSVCMFIYGISFFNLSICSIKIKIFSEKNESSYQIVTTSGTVFFHILFL